MNSIEYLYLINPATEERFNELSLMEAVELAEKNQLGKKAFYSWRNTSLEQRISVIEEVILWFKDNRESVANDITLQMGKPIQQSRNEVRGAVFRMQGLCRIAGQALAGRTINSHDDLVRKISREPLGLVLDIAAWNYPLLIAANIIIAGVLAGNALILKHSSKTPLSGKAFEIAFNCSSAQDNLVQNIICNHRTLAETIQLGIYDHISFTGSVKGGAEVSKSCAGQFIDLGLELGGKDSAYVTERADVESAAANIMDGVLYNAGQSCCGIERIYVHSSKYDEFVKAAIGEMNKLIINDPAINGTTMGPLASNSALSFLDNQREEAELKGAEIHEWQGYLPEKGYYYRPFIALNVSHDMEIMQEESFGPVVGIMAVDSDEEAITRMNDSPYGLTASIWTNDLDRADKIGSQIETGTVFMNCCDVLDPELPWVGIKDSGRGASLGIEGIRQLTRPKVYNFKV